MAKAKVGPDPLNRFVEADPKRILQLVLWKVRHENPEMTVLVSAEDLKGYDECMSYQRISPDVMVYRPEGRPAHPGAPAVGNRRAVPATPAEPPRPYVIVAIVERGTKNVVKPIENNEPDFEKGEIARQIQVAKRNIPTWSTELRRAAASGDFSSGTLEEIARALDLWSRA